MAWRETNRRSHSSPSGGKRSASHRAAQGGLGVAMTARELRTAELENGLPLRGRPALRQQMPGDPQVHNAPVGRGEALRNTPSVQTVLVDGSGLVGGDSRCGNRACRWDAGLARMRVLGDEPKGPPPL